MLRLICSRFPKKLFRIEKLSYLDKLKYCTNVDKDFINKNTVSNPSPNYYDQYIEEYYEPEENIDEEEVIPLHLQEEKIKSQDEKKFIDQVEKEEILEILENERALNIECIDIVKKNDDELKSNDIAIICSPYNKRHGEALTNVIRKYIKNNYRFENNVYPSMVKNDFGWFTYDMRKIILHVMTKEMRERYKLEDLYKNIEEDVEEDFFAERPDDVIVEKDDNENNVIEKEEKEKINIEDKCEKINSIENM